MVQNVQNPVIVVTRGTDSFHTKSSNVPNNEKQS